MSPPVYKKLCKRCEKHYLTYDADKNFCTDTCKYKKLYYEKFKHKDTKLVMANKICKHCGDQTRTKFCNEQCAKQYEKTQRIKEHNKKYADGTVDAMPKKKKITFEQLNRQAEWRRLNDDMSWFYKSNTYRG